MKKFVLFCAAAAMVFCSCSNYTTDKKQPAGISSSSVDSVSYLLGYNIGQQFKAQFGRLNLCELSKGMKDAYKGDVEVSEDSLYETVNNFIETRMKGIAEDNKAEAAAFFEKNGKEEGVVTTESGLQYKIVRQGNGTFPVEGGQTEVNYEGTLLDGTVFDSSYKRGETATFPAQGLIKGWDEGIKFADEGSEIILWIPAELGYGEMNRGIITPNSALKFKIELVKVIAPEVEEGADSTAVAAEPVEAK